MKIKISKFTLTFVYVSLFLMILIILVTNQGCNTGPATYNIPDFYGPMFTRLTSEVFQSTSDVGLVYNVRIKVVDNTSVPKVTLFAKKYGSSNFEKFEMIQIAPFIYSYTLPNTYVSFDYYFLATDGSNVSKLPTDAPNSYFSNLVGVPIVDGDKYYGIEPPLVARPNTNITFSIDIASSTPLENGYPKLIIREIGNNNIYTYSMSKTGEIILNNFQKYTLTLSKDIFKEEKKYEYKIEVKNQKTDVYESYIVTYPKEGYKIFEINKSINLPPIAVIKFLDKKYFVTTDLSGKSDIVLDGSESYDPEDGKENLTFEWKQVSGPNVKTTITKDRLYFTPTVVGSYKFSLRVQDKNGNWSNTYITPLIDVVQTVIPSEAFPEVITNEVILTKAISPITVVKTIVVTNGGILRIEEGVELRFETNTGIIVEKDGTINANGTANERIIFKGILPSSIKGQWNGITILNDIRYPVSSFKYCDIKSAKTAIYIKDSINPTITMCNISDNFDGIYSDNSQVTINQNIITGNDTNGVVCVNNSISTVSSNTITKNRKHGIVCDYSKSQITENNITENQYGILVSNSYISQTMVVNVYNNVIKDNVDGIRIENSDPIIITNQIESNTDNGILCKNAKPQIRSNFISKNHDSGIQMNDCNYREGSGALINNSTVSLYAIENEISNNVIVFSGADGIELWGSNPVINHNIIAYNANAGLIIKSYVDSKNNYVIYDERSGILIINNIFYSNGRCGIARFGTPPDYNPNDKYFSCMSIMINNNCIQERLEYFDVMYGKDLSYTTSEIYFNEPMSPMISLIMVGNNNVLLHVKPETPNINDGRNIRNVNLGLADDIGNYSVISNAFNYSFLLKNFKSNPRNGSFTYAYVDETDNYSVLISSGTSYSLIKKDYSNIGNLDIGLLSWDVRMKK